MTYHAVYSPDGSNEYQLYPPPNGGGVFDTPQIDTAPDGRPIMAGESSVTWQWGTKLEEALTLADYAAIIGKRDPTTGRIRFRTQNDLGVWGQYTGIILPKPGHNRDESRVYGLRIDFDLVVPV